MNQPARFRALVVSLLLTASFSFAQTPPAPASQAVPAAPAPQAVQPPPAAQPPALTQAGGTIHGTVKDGNIPLPGVSVTASNSLTGKKYSTTTDITGSYTLVIPQSGRFVVRTDFPAFATVTKEALLNAATHDQAVDFSVLLASRAAQQEQQQSIATAARQYLGSGAQNLNLLGAASDLIQAGGAGADSGVSLPSLAENSDLASGESVAVSGQTGTTNPFAGVDFGQMREDAQLNQALNGSGEGSRGAQGGGPGGGGGFGGGGGGFRGGG
ncbi:MAG: carboxypeptidase-like regulatory domain-containing protein, partial [Acidobacteriaceae bacterium]